MVAEETPKRDPADTRRRLLDAAGSLMDTHGELGLRVTDVAEAAGTSVGTIYVHFRDRDALVAAVHAERFEGRTKEIVDGAQQIFDAELDRDAYVEAILELLIRPDDTRYTALRWGRIKALAASREDPMLADVIDRALVEIDETLIELFDRAKERGLLRRDITSRAFSLFMQALPVGFVLSDARKDPPPPAHEWLGLMSIIIAALQPPEDDDGPHT